METMPPKTKSMPWRHLDFDALALQAANARILLGPGPHGPIGTMSGSVPTGPVTGVDVFATRFDQVVQNGPYGPH
jgi:hypothetical protein